MMLPIQYSTTCLTLLAVCFVLMGIGCGDSDGSDDAELLIEEEMESFMVTIIAGGAPELHRSDAEILADRILLQETEGIFFDDTRRGQLISEIERELAAIRAAYPTVNTIHALDDFTPDAVKLYLEPGLNEIVTTLIPGSAGTRPIRDRLRGV